MTTKEYAAALAKRIDAVHWAIKGENHLQIALFALLINVEAVFDVCDAAGPSEQVKATYAGLQAMVKEFVAAGTKELRRQQQAAKARVN